MVTFVFTNTIVTYDTSKLSVILPSSLKKNAYPCNITPQDISHIPQVLQNTIHNPRILSTFHVYKQKKFYMNTRTTQKIYTSTFHPDTHSHTTTYYVLPSVLPTVTNSNITAKIYALRIFKLFLKVCAFPLNTR